jgi:hypothetical protein
MANTLSLHDALPISTTHSGFDGLKPLGSMVIAAG